MTMKRLTDGTEKARWVRIATVVLALLLAFSAWPTPTHAAEKVDTLPTVKNFTSARFDLLVTVSADGVDDYLFGQGAVQLPSNSLAWLGVNQTNDRIGVVQIDQSIYINEGEGWQEAGDVEFGGIQALPVSDQLAQLAELADGIYLIGNAPVRGQAATQYQVQISGAQVLDLIGDVSGIDDSVRDALDQFTYKYDFWIGADGTLYQQNTLVSIEGTTIEGEVIPSIQYNSLVTYHDFNDPSITIVAPI